jgi:hypothetical protein
MFCVMDIWNRTQTWIAILNFKNQYSYGCFEFLGFIPSVNFIGKKKTLNFFSCD